MLSHFWLDKMPSYRRWNLCRICAKILIYFRLHANWPWWGTRGHLFEIIAENICLCSDGVSAAWTFIAASDFESKEHLQVQEHLAAQRDEEPAYLCGRADWSKRPTRVLFICSRRSRRQPFRRECVWATIASWIVGKKTILVLWTPKLNSNEGTYILLSVTGNLMSSLFLIFEFSYIPVGSWTTASYYADGNLI